MGHSTVEGGRYGGDGSLNSGKGGMGVMVTQQYGGDWSIKGSN